MTITNFAINMTITNDMIEHVSARPEPDKPLAASGAAACALKRRAGTMERILARQFLSWLIDCCYRVLKVDREHLLRIYGSYLERQFQ
jgi:hypothetical protein